MKKIILSLVMALVLIVATSCSLQSGTTIKFTSLPQPVYTKGHDVENFKENVSIIINNGVPISLKDAEEKGVVVAGLDFNTPGSHTLVIVFNSVSLTFDYEVVEVLETTKVYNVAEGDKKTLSQALSEKAPVIEICENIESKDTFVIDYPVVIYGNGHSLTVTKQKYALNILYITEGKVGLYDLSITRTGSVSFARAININDSSYCEVVLDNCSVMDDSYYGIQACGRNKNITVNIKNGSTAGGYCAIIWWAEASTLNVLDSTLIGNNIYSSSGSNSYCVLGMSDDSGSNTINNTFNLSNVTLEAYSTQGAEQVIFRYADFNSEQNVENFKGNKVYFNDCILKQAEFKNTVFDKWSYINCSTEENIIYLDGEIQQYK